MLTPAVDRDWLARCLHRGRPNPRAAAVPDNERKFSMCSSIIKSERSSSEVIVYSEVSNALKSAISLFSCLHFDLS